MHYRGRFAPSPSGPLHFGSLVAAVASYLEARTCNGTWLVRLEDLDPPRVRPGAADAILRTLERLGLRWDGAVWRQSERQDAYLEALAMLESRQLLRACPCSRSFLAALPANCADQPDGIDELFHPQQCVAADADIARALRFRVCAGKVCFRDRSLGDQRWDVAGTVGDFILQRRDGLIAYQLAVVVDDAAQQVTDIVRGCDLLSSTPRQILLQQALGLPQPEYMHLPLAVDGRGRKLSKSEDAPALAVMPAAGQIVAVLEFLGQSPPAHLGQGPLAEVWEWALRHWQPAGFAGRTTGTAPGEERFLESRQGKR